MGVRGGEPDSNAFGLSSVTVARSHSAYKLPSTPRKFRRLVVQQNEYCIPQKALSKTHKRFGINTETEENRAAWFRREIKHGDFSEVGTPEGKTSLWFDWYLLNSPRIMFLNHATISYTSFILNALLLFRKKGNPVRNYQRIHTYINKQ